jgi:hypothetical protein
MKTFFKLFGIFTVCAIAVGIMLDDGEPRPVKQQSEEQIKRNQEFQVIVSQIRAVRASLHNPASFELVQAVKVGEALCVTYRGSNAFGGIVTNSVAIVGDKKVNYGRYCDDKAGEDFTHARRAI